MSTLAAIGSGLAGACTLTLIHEGARRTIPNAPRMDVLGARSIARGMSAVGYEPPTGAPLHTAALAGDILSNGLYYSLVGLGPPQGACLRGALLGLSAGIGAVVLPGPLGLGKGPSGRTAATQAMTVAWYVAGGLAAGLAYQLLAGATNGHTDKDQG